MKAVDVGRNINVDNVTLSKRPRIRDAVTHLHVAWGAWVGVIYNKTGFIAPDFPGDMQCFL